MKVERLASAAAAIGKIPHKLPHVMLDNITELEEFKVVLSNVCAKEKLQPDEVVRACQYIHDVLPLRGIHGNTETMIIDEEVLYPPEVGALLCLYEVQKSWPMPLPFVRIHKKGNKLGERLKAKQEDYE